MLAAPGRVEARIKLPAGQGLWPAFWMLGHTSPLVRWPDCGELDIMENKGSQFSTTSSAVHGPGYSGNTPFAHAHVLARGTVARIEDLRGKSIAASSPGTPPDMVARAALVRAKVPPAEVKIAAVGGDRDRFTALLGGVVDAAVVSNEYLPLPSVKSMRVLVEARQVLPQFLRFCTLMTGKTLSERREDAIRFMMAQIKALRYAVTHREQTIDLAREATGGKPDDPRPAFVYEEGLKPGAVDPDFSIPVESLIWSQDQMIALGQLAKGGDINRLIYPEIRKEALARIGN